MKELKKVFAKKFWIHVAFFVAAVAVILYFVPGRAHKKFVYEGVGTFYDFLDRLWDSDSDNLSPHIHPIKKKRVKKQNKKAIRQNLLKKSQLNNFSNLWNILLFP